VTHPLYDVLNLLERERLHFRIDRHRPDTVMITVTVVGERLEIDVFDDGHIEYSRFKGDEDVFDDEGALMDLIRRHGREQDGVDPV
jgi:hypothetical protein